MKRDNAPRIPFALLRLFCKPSYVADIEGDLYELFDRDVKTYGQRKATIKLFFNIVRLIRPGLLRSIPSTSINRSAMLKHNFIVSIRSLARNKTSFIVNVFGLSTGLACVLLIGLWIADELSIDQFHVNKDRLYQVCENVNQNEHIITRVSTSGPMAAALLAEYPEVEMAITDKFDWIQTQVLTVGANNIKALEMHADPDFFRMFSFPLIYGSASSVLADKKSIVI